MVKEIKLKINGTEKNLKIDACKRLIDMLREDLNLAGTKEGCGVGECGACTVILNGKAVNSCLILAVQANNSEVITVEGLSENGGLSLLQKNFLKYGAVQCGYCTPGMLMSAYALLLQNPHPSEEEIKTAIEGNLCRCTGYKQIIQAVDATASAMTTV